MIPYADRKYTKDMNPSNKFSVERVYNGWIVRVEDIQYQLLGEAMRETRRFERRFVVTKRTDLDKLINELIERNC